MCASSDLLSEDKGYKGHEHKPAAIVTCFLKLLIPEKTDVNVSDCFKKYKAIMSNWNYGNDKWWKLKIVSLNTDLMCLSILFADPEGPGFGLLNTTRKVRLDFPGSISVLCHNSSLLCFFLHLWIHSSEEIILFSSLNCSFHCTV